MGERDHLQLLTEIRDGVRELIAAQKAVAANQKRALRIYLAAIAFAMVVLAASTVVLFQVLGGLASP